jgi:hypothetical protein
VPALHLFASGWHRGTYYKSTFVVAVLIAFRLPIAFQFTANLETLLIINDGLVFHPSSTTSQ